MQECMTLLGLHLENAWPQVYASGYIVGDTRGASAKDSFVLTLLPICERDYRPRERGAEEAVRGFML